MSQVETLRRWRDDASAEANYKSALFIADKILAMSKDPVDALALAKILFDDRQFARAAHILAPHTDNLQCRRLACRALIQTKEYDTALELVIKTDSTLLCLSGDVFGAKNNFTKAKAAYLEAIALDSMCYQAYERLVTGKLLTSSEQRQLAEQLDFGDLGDCADLFKSLYLIKLAPSYNDALTKDGLDHLSSVYDLDNTCDVLLAQAEMAANGCRYIETREICERAISIDPYYYPIYEPYIACLYELADNNTLFKVGHKLVEQMPNEAVTYTAVGAYYLSIQNASEARHNYSKATMVDPYCLSAWLGFAHTFVQESEQERAITAYSTAARLFPGAHLPWLYLGMQYLNLNNLDVAQEYFAQCEEICDRSDPLLLSELAVLAYNRKDMELAERRVLQALAICATQKYDLKVVLPIKSNYGHILRRLDRNAESLKVFEEVAQHSPLEHPLCLSIGLVHQALGHLDEAIEFFNKALSIKRADAVGIDLLNKAMDKALGSSALAV